VSPFATVRLIALREITERIQGRFTRIMTVVTALFVVAGIVIPAAIKSGSKPTRIGLVGAPAQALAPALERGAVAAKFNVAISDVASVAAARARLADGTLDLALGFTNDDHVLIAVERSLAPTSRALIAAVVDEAHLRNGLAAAGVPLAKVLPSLRPVPIATAVLNPQSPDQSARDVAAIAAGLLMYIALGVYGAAVATGVAQEKTSRTAEVLLAAVRPTQLLTGKVIGIGLTGLGQLAVAAIAGLIANALVHSAKIPSSIWVLLPTFLAFFLAGFALFAFAYAAAGALVGRPEEVQIVSFPLGMPLLIGYLLAYAAVGSPDAGWLKIVSYLPPFTATLMPVRIALGHVAAWEYPLVALLMGLSIYGMSRLAARIYASSLLRGGGRVSWRMALQSRS
jgi:ABC-2 type transport system permease protein